MTKREAEHVASLWYFDFETNIKDSEQSTPAHYGLTQELKSSGSEKQETQHQQRQKKNV